MQQYIKTRQPNTDLNGGQFTPQQKLAVWQKGRVIPDFSPDVWRYDTCGNPMLWSDYGNRSSKFGWEIDHINPVSNGGTDFINNLQPLYWGNNASKSDKLNWRCGQ